MSPRSMISLPLWPAHRILNAAVALLLLQVGLAACGGEPEASDQAEQTTQDQESAPDSETTADADSGFRPQTHGFSFPNYGDEHPEGDLTVAEARRMFGDAACRSVNDKGCRPSLATKMWIKSANQAMAGGHCEGMAVLSALVFQGEEELTRLGGGADDETFDLNVDGNIALQREISYFWATQAVPSVLDATVRGRPSEVLDALRQGLAAGEEQYTIGIYSRAGGGHAVTPFAVVDQAEDGMSHILVYDNNFPGEEKYISVDPEADTWSYATAALNPAEDAEPWEGDAETQSLEITPLSSRVGQLECPYCADSQGASDEVDKASRTTVRLEGTGTLYVQDGAGRRTGQVDGKLLNEIPGARIAPQAGAVRLGAAPLIVLPSGMAFEAFAGGKGADLGNGSLIIIRNGLVLLLDKLTLGPSANHLLVGATGLDIHFVAGAAQQPRIEAALDRPGDERDYGFALGGSDAAAGQEIAVRFDDETEALDLSGSDASASSFDLELEAQDEDSDDSFVTNDLSVDAGAAAIFDLTDWDEGEDLTVGMDENGDGQAESDASLDDLAESDLFSDAELAEEAGWWTDDAVGDEGSPDADAPADPAAEDEATPADEGGDEGGDAAPEESAPDPDESGTGDDPGGDAGADDPSGDEGGDGGDGGG